MFTLTDKGQIKICGNHQEYQVPLIWTFKFHGAEFWCPYCGYVSGMFGAGINVTETEELKERLAKFEEATIPYLSDRGNEVKWTKGIQIEKS